jgi:hypothetical protein
VDPLRRIATAPGEWTAEQVLEALPVHLPPDAPPRDLPSWLRQVSLLSDAATNIGATGQLAGVDGTVVTKTRADAVSEERFAVLAEVEQALRHAEEAGPTLYSALLAHAAAGLAGSA